MSGREPLYKKYEKDSGFLYFLFYHVMINTGIILIIIFFFFSGFRAFIFFSSPIPKELVNHIKSDTSVLPRIGALREVKILIFVL